jgi:hypothetical protein
MSRTLVVACLLTLVGGAAHAQTSPFSREVRTTAGWVFTPGVAAGALWDSGIQTDGNPVVGALFKKWVVTANPRAELDFNGRRTHLNVGYSGSYENYRSDGITNWEHRGRAGLRQTMTRRLDITGDMSYSAVPTSDRLLISDGIVPYVPVDSRWIDLGAGFTYRTGPRTTINGGYRFQRVTFNHEAEAALFTELHDGDTHMPSLGFMRDFTSRLSIGASAHYRRDTTEFDFQEFEVRSLSGDFTLKLSPTSTLSGGAGVSRLSSTFEDSTTSPTFRAGYDRAMRTMRLSASYSRGFEAIYGFGTLAGTDTFSASAFVPLADNVYYLDAVIAYTRSDSVRGLNVGIDYATTWSNVAVGRQLTPYLRGEGFVSYAHQSGSGPGGTDRTRVGIQIVTSKPMRIQ